MDFTLVDAHILLSSIVSSQNLFSFALSFALVCLIPIPHLPSRKHSLVILIGTPTTPPSPTSRPCCLLQLLLSVLHMSPACRMSSSTSLSPTARERPTSLPKPIRKFWVHLQNSHENPSADPKTNTKILGLPPETQLLVWVRLSQTKILGPLPLPYRALPHHTRHLNPISISTSTMTTPNLSRYALPSHPLISRSTMSQSYGDHPIWSSFDHLLLLGLDGGKQRQALGPSTLSPS